MTANIWLPRRKAREDRMNWETGINIYALLCITQIVERTYCRAQELYLILHNGLYGRRILRRQDIYMCNWFTLLYSRHWHSSVTIPLLVIYPDKTIIQKDTYTPMFTAALFTMTRTWKQPRCQSAETNHLIFNKLFLILNPPLRHLTQSPIPADTHWWAPTTPSSQQYFLSQVKLWLDSNYHSTNQEQS